MAYRVIGVRTFPYIEEPASSSMIQDFFVHYHLTLTMTQRKGCDCIENVRYLKKILNFEWKHAF